MHDKSLACFASNVFNHPASLTDVDFDREKLVYMAQKAAHTAKIAAEGDQGFESQQKAGGMLN